MSALEQEPADYPQLRRSLGHDLSEARWLLRDFVAYLDARGAATVTIETALTWARQSPTGRVTTVGPRRMTAAPPPGGFARYLAGIRTGTGVPPLGLMPHRQRWRQPFIYSTADIEALTSQVRCSITSPMRAAKFETLIGLLAAGGMRVGVAWHENVLLIREKVLTGVFTDEAGQLLEIGGLDELVDQRRSGDVKDATALFRGISTPADD